MNNVKNYFWGLCKVVLKILLIGIAMTNFRLRAQNNYLDSRYDYYNMDTTGWVCIGRYDSGNPNWFIFDTIISGNNVFIDNKHYKDYDKIMQYLLLHITQYYAKLWKRPM